MNDREWNIGICGTFDVENYGDLLFPLIAEEELRQRLGRVTLHRFSYRPKTPPDWPYSVRSLAELPQMAGNLDGMIIGGGLLARFDKEVAVGYGPLTPDIHHPTGYWLTPALIAAQYDCPVVWNAIGGQGEIPMWAEPLLELAMSVSSYLSVRDESSKQALGPFAKTCEIQVVPDTAFGIGRLVSMDRPSDEYVRLRDALGLAGPYIVVQATHSLGAFTRLVKDHPRIFENYQLVVLPIGPILGDDAAVFGDELPGSIRVDAWPRPLVIAELIGRATAAVGISLHLTVTAIAFGVPVFRPAEFFDEKYAFFRDFDSVVSFDRTSEIDPHWFAAQLGRTEPSPAAIDAVSRLSGHWDNVASALTADTPPARRALFSRFWQWMPVWLEQMEDRCAAAHVERDAMTVERDLSARRSSVALAERDAARIERDAMRAERDAAYNSNSWKVTAPLRALGRSLRRRGQA